MRLNLQVKEYYGIVRKGLGLSSRKNDAFFAISFFALIFLAPQVIPVTSKADFDMLKSRMASTKAEIRREGGGMSTSQSPDSSPSSKVCLPFPFPFPHLLPPILPQTGSFPFICHLKSKTSLFKIDRLLMDWTSFIFTASPYAVCLQSSRKDEEAVSWAGNLTKTIYLSESVNFYEAVKFPLEQGIGYFFLFKSLF